MKNAPLAEVKALLASQGLPAGHIDIPFTPFMVVAGTRMGGYHFPFPAFGRAVPAGQGYDFQPLA